MTAEAIHSIRLLRELETQSRDGGSLGHEMYELCKVSIKQAKNSIVTEKEAQENLESGCLRRINQILIVAIVIMGILILYKQEMKMNINIKKQMNQLMK